MKDSIGLLVLLDKESELYPVGQGEPWKLQACKAITGNAGTGHI